MTSRQWYTLLLEDNLIMSSLDETSPRVYSPCRTELASPTNDWARTWWLARLKGLGPVTTTFLWRLLHKLIPTQERLSKIIKNKNPSSHCQLCQKGEVENLDHTFFLCSFNSNAGNLHLQCLQTHAPGLTSMQILILNLDVETSKEFPIVWMIGNFLQNIWHSRQEKKKPKLFSIRSDLEARSNLLRNARLENQACILEDLIELCFKNL